MFSEELQDFACRIDFVQKLMAKVESVNSQTESLLGDEIKRKDELLKQRDEELAILRREINRLKQQLAEMKAAKERAETLLQESRKTKESLDAQTENDASGKVPVDPFEILIS
jgi:cell shape-determining protein MreC